MINKRGISPLIATVLIIGFTIVVAVIVITWINGLVTNQTETSDCKASALDTCLSYAGKLQVTYVDLNPVTPNNGDVQASVVNLGPDTINVSVAYLGPNSAPLGGVCAASSITIGPFQTGSAPTCTQAVSGGSVKSIRVLQIVNEVVNGVSCTETCGEGQTILVTI